MATNEPMTAERLAVIRAMLSLTDLGETQHQVMSDLMHEVERLTLLNTHHDEVEREMRQQARAFVAAHPATDTAGEVESEEED